MIDHPAGPAGAYLAKTFGRKCPCRLCIAARGDTIDGFPALACIFVVCMTCGNKRCPHAENHADACTGSNEPNQGREKP